MGSLSEDELDHLEDKRCSPEEIVIQADTDERVRKLCMKLKEPYKKVAVSYFCKNLKLSDVAKETGQSIKTLQTQLYRAKKQLKSFWKEEFI
jgi:RNA polymerase sigma-70 factor (ECF subfamily)